jgi:hypothetical protein
MDRVLTKEEAHHMLKTRANGVDLDRLGYFENGVDQEENGEVIVRSGVYKWEDGTFHTTQEPYNWAKWRGEKE